MKDIILKAIGEDDPSWREFEGDIITQTTGVLIGMKAIGYNEAKAEMRAKIPQIVEEIKTVILKKVDPDTAKFLAFLVEDDETSHFLTVEKKSDEDNKGV